MIKITRNILGQNVELELTSEEVTAIIREYEEKNVVKNPGFRNDDGAAVWYTTIEEGSKTIAEWFLDNRGDYFEYDVFTTDVIGPELVDESDMDAFIVTSDFEAKGIGSSDDAVAVCGRRLGGNITLAYLWRLDYTPSEMYRYFAEEICQAMCDSCGLNKSDHIYLKAGEIKGE